MLPVVFLRTGKMFNEFSAFEWWGWIGLVKADSDWIWDWSWEKVTYSNWGPGEPNGQVGSSSDPANCVLYNAHQAVNQWDDYCCSLDARGICEYESMHWIIR